MSDSIQANDFSAAMVSNIVSVIKNALVTPFEQKRPYGCCRVYISIGSGSVKKSSKLAKALNGLGPIKAFSRPCFSGVNFYVGYDNAHGNITSLAEHMCANLRAAGISAYMDCDGD